MKTKRATPSAWIVLLSLAAGTGCASLGGGGELPPPHPALAGCEPSIAARLQYLEPRLVSHERYANRWWWAWTGVYTGGIVYGSAMAATEDGSGERAKQTVDATKSAIGLAQNVLDPPVMKDGMDGVRDVDVATARGCIERLHAAEELLHAAAEDAQHERRGWLPHAGNVLLNVIGAAIVAEGYDEGSGWSAGAIGIVVGEIRIWTFPWQAEATLADYESRFPRDQFSAPRWHLEEDEQGRTVMVLD